MNRKRRSSENEQNSSSKKMSRGQFLATGATAAAGVSLGYGASGATATVPAASTTASLACDLQCPPLTERWAIPAGVLHTLWSHALPRIMGHAWNKGETIEGWNSSQFALATDPNLLELDPPPPAPWWDLTSQKQWPGSDVHRERLGVLHRYLTGPDGIPITVMGTGGFDFALSDRGLEIFVPERPAELLELLRLYTYRRTGRRSIGVPLYMGDIEYYADSGPIAAISTDSATGPSQINVDVALFAQAVGGTIADLATELGCSQAELASLEAEMIECVGWRRLPAMEDENGNLLQRGRYEVSLETYMCLMERLRCWQISGSVYRAIMTELPRIVATVWLERETVGALDDYNLRFDKRGFEGLRSIFAERLETHIPGDVVSNRMRFRTYDSVTVPLSDANLGFNGDSQTPGWKDSWAPGDVMITNQGLYFPKIEDLLLDKVVQLENMFDQMARGGAGNPVFTDTMRTD